MFGDCYIFRKIYSKHSFRLVEPEDVQYFKFDEHGNMFIYEPGSGISGDCHVLSPGDELIFNKSMVKSAENSDVVEASNLQSDLSTQVVCDSVDNHGVLEHCQMNFR